MAIKDLTKIKQHLFLCNGASCKLLGAEETTVAIRLAITACGLSDEIHTTKTLCNGRCKDGPIVISQPDGIWFKKMVSEDAESFVRKYFVDQITPYEKILYKYGAETINIG
ncbi:MAG: (2Fe-2S) ferredoxin domain-containing protein [Ferruginibacter sp.]